MNAKNCELAIARFDSDDKSKKWEEHVCFVTGRDKSTTKFVYWEHQSNGTFMYDYILPKGRVVSAAPKPGKELFFLGGEFCKLTIDDVVPATKENMAALCLSIEVDTSKVKLGGCYHSGRAYCLGYRTNHNEIELDDKLFTCLDNRIEGGAQAALKRHPSEFPQLDVPRFIVELAAVRIIGEDTENTYCDGCCNLYGNCTCENMCENCHGFDCVCDDDDDDEDIYDNCLTCCEKNSCCICNEDDDLDDDDCLRCGMDSTTCGCWDEDGYCTQCQEICTDCDCLATSGGCMGDPDIDTDEFDDENVYQTFRPMNAFARARWLKACSR